MKTNDDRYRDAEKALETQSDYDKIYPQTGVVDILTNLMHFCGPNELDIYQLLGVAARHYEEELKEEK